VSMMMMGTKPGKRGSYMWARKPVVPTPTAPTPIRTFYVDAASGSDGNAGTIGSPFQTIGKINTTATAGDLFYLKGTFTGTTSLGIGAASGTSSDWIQVAKWPGQSYTLNNGGGGSEYYSIDLSASYWWLSGGTVTPAASAYTAARWTAANHRLVDMTFSGEPRIGCQVYGADNVEFYDCAWSGSHGGTASAAEGNVGDIIMVGQGSDNFKLVRCSFDVRSYHGTVGIGSWSGAYVGADNAYIFDCYFRNTAAGGLWAGYGAASNTVVEWCTFEDMAIAQDATYPPASVEAILCQSPDSTIRFNTIRNGGGRAVLFSSYYFGGELQTCKRLKFHNNTITGCVGIGLYFGGGPTSNAATDLTDNIIENNVIWNNNTGAATEQNGFYESEWYPIFFNLFQNGTGVYGAGSLGGNIFRNNLIGRSTGDTKMMLLIRNFDGGGNIKYTKAQMESTFAGHANNISATDPLQVSSTDAHLQAGSPCIDAGYATSGVSYLGSAVDIGVYEYGGND